MQSSLADFAKFFALSFSALLPLVNPLGSALVFLSIVGAAPHALYRSLAWKIAITTTVFLITIEVIGTAVLRFFGISLPVVQVSGGLTLAAMGWGLLNQQQAQTQKGPVEADDRAIKSLEQKIFYPFTFPITAGPGCIVVMVTLSAHASTRSVLPDIASHAGIFVAILLLSVAVYLCYAYAPAITKRINPQTAHGIIRVMAFVVLCIGVQIMWNGVEVLLKTVLPR
jgi:multiple antibiotic resistance protein